MLPNEESTLSPGGVVVLLDLLESHLRRFHAGPNVIFAPLLWRGLVVWCDFQQMLVF